MARSAAFAAIRHYRMNHVAIADRTPQQAQVLKSMFSGSKTKTKIETHELFPPDIAQLLAEARLIINATTIGSADSMEETPITLPDIFNNRQIVVDVNYNPVKTKMLTDAEESGAKTINGVEIMLKQLEGAFALLTDAEFPVAVARELIEANGKTTA